MVIPENNLYSTADENGVMLGSTVVFPALTPYVFISIFPPPCSFVFIYKFFPTVLFEFVCIITSSTVLSPTVSVLLFIVFIPLV